MSSARMVTSRQVAVIEKAGVPAGIRPLQDVLLPGLRIRVLSSEPILLLGGETIAAATKSTSRRQLINRLFSIPSLNSLRLNWRKGEVRLEFAGRLHSTADVLGALASAMSGRPPAALPLLHEEVIL